MAGMRQRRAHALYATTLTMIMNSLARILSLSM
jgi:hypothetical protein